MVEPEFGGLSKSIKGFPELEDLSLLALYVHIPLGHWDIDVFINIGVDKGVNGIYLYNFKVEGGGQGHKEAKRFEGSSNSRYVSFVYVLLEVASYNQSGLEFRYKSVGIRFVEEGPFGWYCLSPFG